MPVELLTVQHTPAAIISGPVASQLAWDLIVGAVVLVALARILTLPAEQCRYRFWTKVGWILATLWVTWTLGGYPVPIGALAAIYRTRRQRHVPNPADVPLADGDDEWPGAGR